MSRMIPVVMRWVYFCAGAWFCAGAALSVSGVNSIAVIVTTAALVTAAEAAADLLSREAENGKRDVRVIPADPNLWGKRSA